MLSIPGNCQLIMARPCLPLCFHKIAYRPQLQDGALKNTYSFIHACQKNDASSIEVLQEVQLIVVYG